VKATGQGYAFGGPLAKKTAMRRGWPASSTRTRTGVRLGRPFPAPLSLPPWSPARSLTNVQPDTW